MHQHPIAGWGCPFQRETAVNAMINKDKKAFAVIAPTGSGRIVVLVVDIIQHGQKAKRSLFLRCRQELTVGF